MERVAKEGRARERASRGEGECCREEVKEEEEEEERAGGREGKP